MNKTKTLYSKDAKGDIRVWSITPNVMGYTIEYGKLNGKMQLKREGIFDGKQNRTREEQIDLKMNSAISRQRDKGYVDTIEEAMKGATNALGLYKPMLAQTLEGNEIDYATAFIQRKYDGNRCIIGNDGTGIKAYSRNGKLIDSISHILDAVNLQPGVFIDGELYCHGEKLQTIVSWIKRKQADTEKLKFHVYDSISDKPFQERFESLIKYQSEVINIVPTHTVNSFDDAMTYFKQFRAEGYEGAIIRHTTAGYEDGKRSKSLLKLKEWHDAEFKVLDIIPSKDEWARLVCRINKDKTFTVTCHGDHVHKIHVMQNKDDYIGRLVTVEYAYLTADGIPFHPVAKCWREEL